MKKNEELLGLSALRFQSAVRPVCER